MANASPPILFIVRRQPIMKAVAVTIDGGTEWYPSFCVVSSEAAESRETMGKNAGNGVLIDFEISPRLVKQASSRRVASMQHL